MGLLPADFKSAASADFAIRAIPANLLQASCLVDHYRNTFRCCFSGGAGSIFKGNAQTLGCGELVMSSEKP